MIAEVLASFSFMMFTVWPLYLLELRFSKVSYVHPPMAAYLRSPRASVAIWRALLSKGPHVCRLVTHSVPGLGDNWGGYLLDPPAP